MAWSNHFLESLSEADLALIRADLIKVDLSRDEVLAQARAVCLCSVVASFPETVVLKGVIKRAYA